MSSPFGFELYLEGIYFSSQNWTGDLSLFEIYLKRNSKRLQLHTHSTGLADSDLLHPSDYMATDLTKSSR